MGHYRFNIIFFVFLNLISVGLYSNAQDIIREIKTSTDSSIYLRGVEEINSSYYLVGRINVKGATRPFGKHLVVKLDNSLNIISRIDIDRKGALVNVLDDGNGNLLICGEVADSLSRINPYIAKIDTNGNIIWEKKIGKPFVAYSKEIRFYKIFNYEDHFLVLGSTMDNEDSVNVCAYFFNSNGDSLLLVKGKTTILNNPNVVSAHLINYMKMDSKVLFVGEWGGVGIVFTYDLNTGNKYFNNFRMKMNLDLDMDCAKIYEISRKDNKFSFISDLRKFNFSQDSLVTTSVDRYGKFDTDTNFNILEYKFFADSIDDTHSDKFCWNISSEIFNQSSNKFYGYNFNIGRTGSLFPNGDFVVLKTDHNGFDISRKKIEFPGYQYIYSYIKSDDNSIVAVGASVNESNNFNSIVMKIDTMNFVGFDNIKNRIIAYPNPTNKFLLVESIDDISNAELSIKNSLGKEMKSFTLMNNNIINVEQLPSGLYYLRIRDKNGEVFLKFIKN